MTHKTAPPPPAVVGAYDVLDKIAEGSMSKVYRGRSQASGETVAIKIFTSALTEDPVLLKRFMQEIRTARSLDHPHLVRGIDFGFEDGVLYLVMEFVEGESLGDRLERDGKLPEEEAVQVVTQVAQALHAAHQKGIIHRDVKPDNILLTSDGQSKLTDLGLMKNLGTDLDLTRPAKGLGTPNFIPPEQFDNAKNATVRCDIYSLAATLYMTITGELPFFSKTTPGIWKKKMDGDLTPPRKLVPTIDKRVERAMLRGMSVDPAKRQASCAEFVEDLTGRKMPEAVVVEAPAPPPQPKAEAAPKGAGGADRRVKVRFPSTLDGVCTPIGDEDQLAWSGKIQDISESGIGLILGRRFEKETVLSVELKGRSRSTHTLLVRVVRVSRKSPKRWNIGCVFARDLTDDDVRDLL